MRDFGTSGRKEVSLGGGAWRRETGATDCACAADKDSTSSDVRETRKEARVGGAGWNRNKESSRECERWEAHQRELPTAGGSYWFARRIGAGATDDRAARDVGAEVNVSWRGASGNLAHCGERDQCCGLPVWTVQEGRGAAALRQR